MLGSGIVMMRGGKGALKRILAQLALVGAVSLGSASLAHADATTDAAALKQFEAGRAAFDKNDFATALKEFTASMAGLPSPNTRLYIARCQRSLGKIGSAFTSYKLAAREATDRLNATGEKRYAATKETAQAEAAEIEKNVPHLTIQLPADVPAETSIKLDDSEIPRTALSNLDVDPGPHVLGVTAPRRSPFLQKVDLAPGESKTVDVTMTRLPTAMIQVVFASKPTGLALEIDGKPVDPTRSEKVQEVDVGTHRVVVRAPGYRDFEWKQALGDGDSKKIDVKLDPAPGAGGGSSGTPKWLFFGVAGLSVVALGVGGVVALDASSRADAEKQKDPLQRETAEREDIKSQATTANVLFITGGALVGGAIALFFLTDWKSSSTPPPATIKTGKTNPSKPKMIPLLGLGAVGLQGSF